MFDGRNSSTWAPLQPRRPGVPNWQASWPRLYSAISLDIFLQGLIDICRRGSAELWPKTWKFSSFRPQGGGTPLSVGRMALLVESVSHHEWENNVNKRHLSELSLSWILCLKFKWLDLEYVTSLPSYGHNVWLRYSIYFIAPCYVL